MTSATGTSSLPLSVGELQLGIIRVKPAPRRIAPAQAPTPRASPSPWVARRPAAARPDRHHGRRHERDLLGPSSRRARCRASGRFPSGGAGCSARSMPTGPALWHTPDAGGKVDKDNPTQVGRALQRLGRAHRSLFARAGGALPGPREPRGENRATRAFPPAARVRTAADPRRPARRACTPSLSTDPDAWPATRPAANPSTPQPGRPRDPLRRDQPKPCGQVDSRCNRSGQLIWYINRSVQNVLDTPPFDSPRSLSRAEPGAPARGENPG